MSYLRISSMHKWTFKITAVRGLFKYAMVPALMHASDHQVENVHTLFAGKPESDDAGTPKSAREIIDNYV